MHAEEFLFHALNSIAVLVDMFVGARPFYLLHYYQPAFVMLGYGVFTVIYWAAGGLGIDGNDYIYWIINWDKPGFTILVIMILFVLMFLEQVLIWGLHCLRDFLYRKCVKRQKHSEILSGQHNTGFEG